VFKHLKLSTINTHPPYLLITHIRAVDGDVLEAHVHLPLEVILKRRIRLKHFFAPEHHGRTPEAATAATERLQQAVDGHVCHIHCHGMKLDRYGRILAQLVIDGRPVEGGSVLGSLQLTLEAHKADLDHARKGAGQSAAL
jgi:endonuclease YncB( thermonuclease family)